MASRRSLAHDNFSDMVHMVAANTQQQMVMVVMPSDVEEKTLRSMEHARGRIGDIYTFGENQSRMQPRKALPSDCLRFLIRRSHVLLKKPISG